MEYDGIGRGSEQDERFVRMNVPRRVKGPGGHQREQEAIRHVEGDSCRVNTGDGIDNGVYAHFPAGSGMLRFPWETGQWNGKINMHTARGDDSDEEGEPVDIFP